MKKNSFSFAAAFVALALFGGGMTSVGCGGASVSSLCEEFCACQRCTSNDQNDCEVAGQSASDKAEAAGCSSQFDDVVSCATTRVSCDSKVAVVKGCEVEQAALEKCSSATTPAQKDDCQKASDQVTARLSTCAVTATITPTGTTSCSATQGPIALCTAACLDAASCDFLKCAIGSDMAACSTMPSGDSTAFSACISTCNAIK